VLLRCPIINQYEHQGPLTLVDHEVSDEFGAFIAKHQETRDPHVQLQLQNDLVEHLWRGKEIPLDVCLDLLECLCELLFYCLNYCNTTIWCVKLLNLLS
jgi:hypothetical protein